MKRLFESLLWNARFIVLLAVVASLIGTLLLFVMATGEVLHLAWAYVEKIFLGVSHPDFHIEAVGVIITAVDEFLLATVLLIFALGMYELFVSDLEAARSSEQRGNILMISSLDDLKDRLGKVVLMILVVAFFKNVLHVTFDNPLNILYMGAGILLVSLALYFSHRH